MRLVLAYPEDADSTEKAAMAERAALEVCLTAGVHPYMAWHDYSLVHSGLNLPSSAFATAEIAGAFVWIEAIAAAQEFLNPPRGAKVEIDVLFEPGDEMPLCSLNPAAPCCATTCTCRCVWRPGRRSTRWRTRMTRRPGPRRSVRGRS